MTAKKVVAWMVESSCLRTPFGSQSSDGKQTLLKSVWHDLYPNFPLILEKLSQKTCLFVPFEILGMFGNTLAADDMYSRHNWAKFPQHVKTPLSQKQKTFSEIFIAFLEFTQNFAHFEKRGQLYGLNSWEVIVSEKCGCLNARKLLFRNTLLEWKCSWERNTA